MYVKIILCFIVNKYFFLLIAFSAYEEVGKQFRIESRIISSSVEPPPGKLVKPVTIVFGGVQVISFFTGLRPSCPLNQI